MINIFSVVNLSEESPQKDSLAKTPREAIQKMVELQKLGANYVDIGARSSFSKSDELDEAIEGERLSQFFGTERPSNLLPLSLDTWSITNAKKYLSEIAVLNYTSTYFPDDLVDELARTGCPLVMNYLAADNPYALRKIPYTPPSKEAMMEYFSVTVPALKNRGVKILAIDPNLGMWHPETPNELKPILQRSIIEAIPEIRKIAPVFIVAPRTNGVLNKELVELLLSKGVDYIRTHDLSMLLDLMRQAGFK
jgi:dihydropteroate synthase